MATKQIKKNDIRWIRTERYLMKAFGEALQTEPIDKIKVTEIARAAEINKATFYLHYHDVYDLAENYARNEAKNIVENIDNVEDFFYSPKHFVTTLVNALSEAQVRQAVENIALNRLMPLFMNGLCESLDSEFRKIRPVPEDNESSIVVAFFTHGLMGALAQYRALPREMLINVLTAMLESMTERGRTLDEAQARIQRYSTVNTAAATLQAAKLKEGKKPPLRERPNRNSADYWIKLANRDLK